MQCGEQHVCEQSGGVKLHDDEQLDEEITLPENNHLRINRRDECKMQ